MEEYAELGRRYAELMGRQQFDPAQLDAGRIAHHRQFLEQLALVNNSAVTIFDLHRRHHVFASYNFPELFGFDPNAHDVTDNDVFDERLHPEDRPALMRSGIDAFLFWFGLPADERLHYKLLNEYRIRNGAGDYLRVIEQHQALELAPAGQVWLTLGVIDISPNQDHSTQVRSQMFNYKTGRIYDLSPKAAASADIDLTRREREILQLVKEGLLSKEISDRLSISIHTVNTHRQRILEKLGVDNSMEAVRYAAELGLV